MNEYIWGITRVCGRRHRWISAGLEKTTEGDIAVHNIIEIIVVR